MKTVSCVISPSPKQNAAVLTRVKGSLRRFAPLTRAASCGRGNPRATILGMEIQIVMLLAPCRQLTVLFNLTFEYAIESSLKCSPHLITF